MTCMSDGTILAHFIPIKRTQTRKVLLRVIEFNLQL